MLIDFLKAIKAYAENNPKNTVKGDNQFFIETLDNAISSCLDNQTNLDKQHLEALSTYHKVIRQIILIDTTTRDLYINNKEALQNTLNTSDFIEMHKKLAVNLSWRTKILSTNIIPTEGLHTTPNNAEIIDTFEKLTPLVTKLYQDRLIEIKVNYLNTGNLNQLADQIKQFNQEFKQDRTAFDKASEALGNFFYLFDLLYQKIRTYLLRENQEKTMNDTYNPLARWYSKGRYDFFFTPPKLQQGLQFLENAPQETNKGPF